MKKRKKILSILIKILIGAASVALIYVRLRADLTPEKLSLLSESALSWRGAILFIVCLLLIPVNWGLESLKWQLITAPVERVSYRTASKSVYAGVFLGNLAPGRATEFVARIIFFHIGNRPQITVLHFVGGMFQLSITVLAGFAALLTTLQHIGENSAWMVYVTSAVGVLLIIALIICIWRIDTLLHFIARKISRGREVTKFHYRFTPRLLTALFGCSLLRYFVFVAQFVLLLQLFQSHFEPSLLSGIALYFLVTTTIPMISVLEAAIRAAVALVVFRGTGLSEAVLALSSVLIWLVNIIIPSIFGYAVLLRQNFNFKLFRTRRA